MPKAGTGTGTGSVTHCLEPDDSNSPIKKTENENKSRRDALRLFDSTSCKMAPQMARMTDLPE